MPKYAELLYNGFWYSPERLALQAAIDKTQEFVTGTVRLKLYKVTQRSQAACYRTHWWSTLAVADPAMALGSGSACCSTKMVRCP